MAVPLPWEDEGDVEEVLAPDLERTPGGGERKLVRTRDVHVQHLQQQ